MSVQDIKDTFYSTMRDRIAAANPGRTMVVRGTTRTAVLVEENELLAVATAPDAYDLNWTALAIDAPGLVKLTCEIHYASAGSASAGGMDRGRALAALDAELRGALELPPLNAALLSFTEVVGGGALTQSLLGSNIFWSSPAFGPLGTRNERLERSVTVEVFGYE